MRLNNIVVTWYAALLCNFSLSQSLSLEDIFKIHSLDSVPLKQFMIEKNYRLVMIDEDDWAFEYLFQSNVDEKKSVQRIFHKEGAGLPFVRYYFNNQQEYKIFENSIKEKGFTRFKDQSSLRKDPTRISTKRFASDTSNLEIGLETDNRSSSKYALTLGSNE
jgi:hypothetical protein